MARPKMESSLVRSKEVKASFNHAELQLVKIKAEQQGYETLGSFLRDAGLGNLTAPIIVPEVNQNCLDKLESISELLTIAIHSSVAGKPEAQHDLYEAANKALNHICKMSIKLNGENI